MSALHHQLSRVSRVGGFQSTFHEWHQRGQSHDRDIKPGLQAHGHLSVYKGAQHTVHRSQKRLSAACRQQQPAGGMHALRLGPFFICAEAPSCILTQVSGLAKNASPELQATGSRAPYFVSISCIQFSHSLLEAREAGLCVPGKEPCPGHLAPGAPCYSTVPNKIRGRAPYSAAVARHRGVVLDQTATGGGYPGLPPGLQVGSA